MPKQCSCDMVFYDRSVFTDFITDRFHWIQGLFQVGYTLISLTSETTAHWMAGRIASQYRGQELIKDMTRYIGNHPDFSHVKILTGTSRQSPAGLKRLQHHANRGSAKQLNTWVLYIIFNPHIPVTIHWLGGTSVLDFFAIWWLNARRYWMQYYNFSTI